MSDGTGATRGSSTTGSETLTTLYDAHEAGELDSLDKRWLQVEHLLRGFVRRWVPSNARNLYGPPLNDLVDEVHAAVLRKFVARRLGRHGDVIEPLLVSVVRNETLSALRKGRSLTAVLENPHHFEHQEGESKARREVDLFSDIHARLEPFRFREHPGVRELMLAVFLATGSFPGPGILANLNVTRLARQAVHNAAMVDCNRAMRASLRA